MDMIGKARCETHTEGTALAVCGSLPNGTRDVLPPQMRDTVALFLRARLRDVEDVPIPHAGLPPRDANVTLELIVPFGSVNLYLEDQQELTAFDNEV